MMRSHASFVDPRRRHTVLIGLFDALDRSGVRPVKAHLIHMLWYLANALAPAWRLQPFDAALLKTDREPFFPSIQSDLDRLIGKGLLRVATIAYASEIHRFEAFFALNRALSDRILATMGEIKEEADLLHFLSEVVQAANRLSEANKSHALSQDATYGDPSVDAGNVIDLGQWLVNDASTPTANVLDCLDEIANRHLQSAERMELYIDHLGRRLRSA